MATKKNEEKKSLKFIDVLNDFREGKEVEFSNVVKERDIQEIMSIIDDILLGVSFLNSKKKELLNKEINKQMAIFFYGLLQCTSLKIEKEDICLENYDIRFEHEILRSSISAQKIIEITNNVFREKQLEVISLLTEEFKNIPGEESLDKLEEKMTRMFNNRSSEDLKMINNILDYNDPTLKAIKEIIFSSAENISNEEMKKNGNNNTKG